MHLFQALINNHTCAKIVTVILLEHCFRRQMHSFEETFSPPSPSAMAAAEEDIDPIILSRIEQISQMLSQTNQNLSLFERLLPATSASRTTAPDQNSVDEVAGLKDRVADLEISNQNSMKKVAELEWKLLETENRLQG